MLPGIDGFSWSAGNLIFLGAFYTVAAIIAAGVSCAVICAIRDFRSRRADRIAWKADFEDLPAGARCCRHELTGEAKHRICPNGFDCAHCQAHPLFVRAREAAEPVRSGQEDAPVFGLHMPADRMYHRGHTWVQPQPDGTFLVGLDDFASRLVGNPDDLELPESGATLHANGTACRIRKGRSSVRILSPIDGEVIETGGNAAGWLFRLKGLDSTDTRPLLQAEEIRPWMLREIDRLQVALSAEGVGASLADGGEIVRDLPAACPAADWDEVWAEIFLEA